MNRSLPFLIALVLALPVTAAPELPETVIVPEERSDEEMPSAKVTAEEQGMPEEELACRKRLRDLGVSFVEHKPLDEPEGCSAPWPVTITGLPSGIELRPEAVLTCAMAEATARFVTDHAMSISRAVMDEDIVAIDQVSSYVCRPRNDGSQLSEHAFANALDWGALELADGTRIDIIEYPRTEKQSRQLIGALQKAACGPFKTVLGPGSDADHADHFHFDLAKRRNGGTWCR